jgi:hypothetical protein
VSEHLGDRLAEYFDGELPSDEVAEVREHLASCAECQTTLDAWRAVEDIAHRQPAPEMAAGRGDLATRVRAQLLAEAAQKRARPARWLAAAAAVAALGVLPWYVLQRSSLEAPSPQTAAVEAPSPADRRLGRLDDAPREAAPATAAPTRAASPPSPPAKPFAAPPAESAESARSKAEQRVAREDKKADELASTRRTEASADEGRTAGYAAAPPPAAPPPAPAPTSAAAPAAAAEPMVAADAPAPPAGFEDADMRQRANESAGGGRNGVSLGAASAKRAQATQSGPQTGADSEDAFRSARARGWATAEEARQTRDAWEAYLRRYPSSPHRETAGFAAVEAADAAYRCGVPAGASARGSRSPATGGARVRAPPRGRAGSRGAPTATGG